MHRERKGGARDGLVVGNVGRERVAVALADQTLDCARGVGGRAEQGGATALTAAARPRAHAAAAAAAAGGLDDAHTGGGEDLGDDVAVAGVGADRVDREQALGGAELAEARGKRGEGVCVGELAQRQHGRRGKCVEQRDGDGALPSEIKHAHGDGDAGAGGRRQELAEGAKVAGGPAGDEAPPRGRGRAGLALALRPVVAVVVVVIVVVIVIVSVGRGGNGLVDLGRPAAREHGVVEQHGEAWARDGHRGHGVVGAHVAQHVARLVQLGGRV